MRNRAYDRAEAAYLQALQDDAKDADVYNSLGAVYEAQERPREAETAYRQALALASDHTRARLNLGNLLRREQRFAEAKSLFLAVLASDPRPAIQYEGHYYLGYLHLDQRDYLRAYDFFATALKSQQRAKGFYALANACHHLGRQDEQIRHLRQAVALEPEFGRCLPQPWSLVPAARRIRSCRRGTAPRLAPRTRCGHCPLQFRCALRANWATGIGPARFRNCRATAPGKDVP